MTVLTTRRARPARGFSFVELTLMIAIIGVLAAIASPRYADSLARYRCGAAAQRVAADVNLARWRARATSAGQTMAFDTAANRYSLPGVAALSGRTGDYAVSLADEPYAAVLTAVAFGSATKLTFDRFGQPASGGTVTVRSGVITRVVTVDGVTGLASLP